MSDFISLDGVIQAPGGADEDTDGGFTQSGWTHPYCHDEISTLFTEAFSEADALLLGRRTWEGHGAAFNPLSEGDPFGDPMKAIKKYVVSTTLSSTDIWRNSTLIGGDVVEQVRALKAQPGKNILLDGSSVLVHTLIKHDLVDEYRLLVYPLVLGGGKKLFPEGLRLNLRLVGVKAIPSGITLMRYARIDTRSAWRRPA